MFVQSDPGTRPLGCDGVLEETPSGTIETASVSRLENIGNTFEEFLHPDKTIGLFGHTVEMSSAQQMISFLSPIWRDGR